MLLKDLEKSLKSKCLTLAYKKTSLYNLYNKLKVHEV